MHDIFIQMDLEYALLDIKKILSSLSIEKIFVFSVINGIDSHEKLFITHHFVCEVITHGDFSYTHDNLINMIIKVLLIPKSDNRLNLVDANFFSLVF